MKTRRNYPLLLASQFFSAFGDQAVLGVILGQLTFQHQQGSISGQQLSNANALYACLLYLPYVAFAPIAGFLNDRFAKTRWLLGGNCIKLCGVAIAALSLLGPAVWQSVGYLIIGIGACIYSPAKYGILPEIVPTERLVKANGTVEMLTLVAILSGVMAGAWMIDTFSVAQCYTVLASIFVISLTFNLFMAKTPYKPSVRLRSSVMEFFQHFKILITSPRVSKMLFGTAIFWACGAILKMNFQRWGLSTLGLEKNTDIAFLNLWLVIGIMVGSILAGQLHRVGDLRSTQRYGWALAGMIVLLGLINPFTHHTTLVFVLIMAGVCGGLFLIPLNAGIQAETDETKLGKTIASQNFLNSASMLSGGGFIFLGAAMGASASGIFLLLAGIIALLVFWLRIPVNTQPETKGAL